MANRSGLLVNDYYPGDGLLGNLSQPDYSGMTHYPSNYNPVRFPDIWEGIKQGWNEMNTLQKMGFLPVVGDVSGFAGDMQEMIEKPESRTWTNAALAGAGLLPFVPPGLFGISKVTDDIFNGIPENAEAAYKAGTDIRKHYKPKDFSDVNSNRYWQKVLYDQEGTGLAVPEWVVGSNSPEIQAFLYAGLLGDDIPKKVSAWRYGDIPEKRMSFNKREGDYEKGVSVMEIIDGDRIKDHVSGEVLKLSGRPKVNIEGFVNPYYTGADGEPLILYAKKVID